MAFFNTTDDVVTDAKLRAFYPTSGGVLSDADILRLGSDEMLSILTAQEMSAIQGHLAMEMPVPLVANQARYDVPYRAAGGKIRYICLRDANNNRYPLAFGRPERYVTNHNIDSSLPGVMPQAAWFEDGRLVLYPPPANALYTMILGVYMRPSRLVFQASGARVSAVASAGAATITCAALPSNFNTLRAIDIISFHPPFQVLAYNLATSAMTTGATTITIAAAGAPYETGTLAYGLNVGDWITTPEETVVPQLPSELHPLLSARVAKRILQARGDTTNLEVVSADIKEMESQMYEFLSNRNEGQIDTLGSNNLIDSGRSRFGFGLGGF